MLWASSRNGPRRDGGAPRDQPQEDRVKNGKALRLAGGLVACATLAAAQEERSGKVAEVYAERCAACHGAKLQGGQSKSLLDDEWKYGGDDPSLMASIRDGRLDAGMPPFGAMMSEQEIRALVIFIREKADAARRAETVFARPKADTVTKSEEHAFKLETVSEGLETPWAVAFLPDGRLLVTEKAGRLRIVDKGKLVPTPVAGVPPVWSEGQGGLMDVAVHPDYASNGWIYLSYSHPGPDGSAMTRVLRGRLTDGALVDQETLFAPPVELYRKGEVHFGSRFVFDGKGYLFFSIGERGRKEDAQDLSRPNGKLHRIRDDGRVPEDNPFVKTAGALPTIWSYGHRNPQGLAIHPTTGDIWLDEHGPQGGDELNLVRRGANYGWPVIGFGVNYQTGLAIHEGTHRQGMETPVHVWVPSIATSGLLVYTGDKFPEWRGNLFVGGMAGQKLARLTMNGQRVVQEETLMPGVGRVRDIRQGPDGDIYVAIENREGAPTPIVRLEPVGS
jgi:glucose/arabinose dehydrogenase